MPAFLVTLGERDRLLDRSLLRIAFASLFSMVECCCWSLSRGRRARDEGRLDRFERSSFLSRFRWYDDDDDDEDDALSEREREFLDGLLSFWLDALAWDDTDRDRLRRGRGLS